MTVYDRWHKSRPAPGEEPCREHSRGNTKLYPSADHGKGDRWQVRWRDETGNQRKRNFAKRDGIDSEKHASAFDVKVRAALDDGSYVDPKDANTTFRNFAEDWRQTRTHDVTTAGRIERELRLHVYPFIGGRSLRELAKRPSLTQAWISGMKLAASSKRQVIRDVSSVYVAAIDDGLINRNPTQAQSVTRPKAEDKKAQPWTFAQVESMARSLPGRYAVLPYLAAGTGMRQGEMFGLAVDDVVFLGRRPVVHVNRQVRIVSGVLCFAPVKNDKEHDVPLSEALVPLLAEHIRQYPPRAVIAAVADAGRRSGHIHAHHDKTGRAGDGRYKIQGIPLVACSGESWNHSAARERPEATPGTRSGSARPATHCCVGLAGRRGRYRVRGCLARRHCEDGL